MKYTYNPQILLNKDDISYYILGAFISDGCIQSNMNSSKSGKCGISSVDLDWLELIRNKLSPKTPITKIDNCYNVFFYNKFIFNFFIQNECVPRKSLIVKLPIVPDEYFPDFMRGCIDGDGCIYINGKRMFCELSGASKDFMESLMLRLKPYNPKLYCNKDKYYKLRFNGTYAYAFLKYIYYDNHQMSMERKYVKAKKFINYFNSFNLVNEIENEAQFRKIKQSGSNNGRSKLNENEVKEIRIKLSNNYKKSELSKEYNVSTSTIKLIANKKIWKHI